MTSPTGRASHVRVGLGGLLFVGALAWSVAVRVEVSGPPSRADESARLLSGASAAGGGSAASSTDLLLDLRDDLDGAERARIARLIDDAVAPLPWTDGSLGEELSAAARLYRVHIPVSELADVVGALRDADAVESLEQEHALRLPEDPAFVDVTPGHGSGAVRLDGDPESSRGVFRPNDPYYRHQWHLDQIQMPAAWMRSRGRGAVVAVIDTGVLYRDHARGRRAPDLAGTRFAPGWDFVDDDATPDDEHGHGTHVAGTIAQSTHNAVGVAGVAPLATIMPVRVLDARGAGRSGDIAAAIRWAVDHGANIINMSLGGGLPTRATATAVRYAHDQGVLVVAAAGNTGRGRVEYPAAHDYVVAVGAVRADGTRAFYSSYGAALDLMAPGGDLRVDQNGDGMPDGVVQNTMLRGDPMRHDYLGFQGTSMAAPHVAGVAALLYAEGLRDPAALERALRETAREVGPANDFGSGIVQADAALEGLAMQRGWGGLAGSGLALMALFGGARRRQRALAIGPWAAGVGAFTAGGGVAALVAPWPLTAAASAWCGPQAILQLGDVAALVGYSAGLPLLAYALFGSVKRLAPWLAVLAFGVAGQLLLEALLPTVRVALLPAIIAGPWLLGQLALCLWLGWAAAQRR